MIMTTSRKRQQYHESITIDPYNHGSNAKGVKVSLQMKAIYNMTSSTTDDHNLLINRKHSFLISILEMLKLDSFSVSISDSSDDSILVSDLNRFHSIFKKPLTFPVGTAVQYNPTSTTSGTDANADITKKNITTIDEKVLLRLLSSNGFMCQNVQLNDQLRSIHASSIGAPFAEPNDNTRIIMIPNDAYTLCHTRILQNIIVSSSPCQDKLGVFSKFHFHTLNNGNVFHKASWMNVRRNHDLGIIEIEWGIRFRKMLPNKINNVSLFDIYMDESSTELYEEHLELQHCPLTESSTIFSSSSSSSSDSREYKKYDLKVKPIAINKELLTLDVSNNEDAIIGIDRHVLRPSGIAHFGTFQSRFYYNCNTRCQSDYLSTKGVNISILDYYPHIIKPNFHSLRAFLLVESDDGIEIITELSHGSGLSNLQLVRLPDGSSTFSCTSHLPPNSSLLVEMDYEPYYIPFEHFPADPNRGFDIPPSYATFSLLGQSPHKTQLYSNALLVMSPVPDMSMPFNVISLSCTCFALLIGSAVNMIIKKSSQNVSDALKGVKAKTPIQKIKERLRSKIILLKQKMPKWKKIDDTKIKTL